MSPDADVTFADILRTQLEDQRRTQAWLGAETAKAEGLDSPIDQPTISTYLAGRAEPSPRRVFAMERALNLPPGSLSRLLGYLPPDAVASRTVPQAVAADPSLDAQGRRSVMAVYEVNVRVRDGASA